jgi:hypothetical protein
MRKLVLIIAALVAYAFVVPFASTANAETTKKVIIKRGGHDRGHHRAWRGRGGGKKVVIIKKRGRGHRD